LDHIRTNHFECQLCWFIIGVYNFRKSWKYYEEVLNGLKEIEKELGFDYTKAWDGTSERPHNPESRLTPMQERILCHVASLDYFGAGMFHYAIDLVPKRFKWIVEGVLSLKADRELAVKELQISADCNALNCKTMTLLLSLFSKQFFFSSTFGCDGSSCNPCVLGRKT
jgi:hypothetical protein